VKQTKTITAKVKAQKAAAMGQVSSQNTRLQVGLWTTPASPGESATVPPIIYPATAAQMIGDLVLVTNGELHTCSETGVSATYRNARQAIVAVRHLQHLIRGFSSAGHAGSISACFSLYHAGDVPADDDVDPAATNRREADKVLLLGNVCAEAKSIPGLRFKDATGGNPKRSGTVLELLPPVYSSTSKLIPSSPPAPAQSSAPRLVLNTKTPSQPQPPAVQARPKAAVLPTSSPEASLAASARRILHHLLASPRSRLIGGVAAGCVALLVLGFSLKPLAKSKTASPSSPPLRKVDQPARTAPQLVASPSYAPANPTPSSPAPIAPDRSKQQSQPPAKPSAAGPPKVAAATKEPAAPAMPMTTYSSSDISLLISRADRLAGDGHYDRAITMYRAILKQDPRNVPAQEGLKRALRNQNQD